MKPRKNEQDSMRNCVLNMPLSWVIFKVIHQFMHSVNHPRQEIREISAYLRSWHSSDYTLDQRKFTPFMVLPYNLLFWDSMSTIVWTNLYHVQLGNPIFIHTHRKWNAILFYKHLEIQAALWSGQKCKPEVRPGGCLHNSKLMHRCPLKWKQKERCI